MKPHLLSALLALTMLSACKKDDKIDDKEEEPSNNQTLTLTTGTAVPGQLVVAQANFDPIVSDTTKITVNGKKVTVYATDSNQVVFILPELPAGKVTIDYTPVGVAKQLSLTVGSYTAITDPTQVLEDFTTAVNGVITAFEAHENSQAIHFNPAYGDVLKYMKETITENFTALSPAEQLQLAYFLKNNKPDPGEFQLDELNPLYYQRVEGIDTDPGERLWKVALGFRTSVTRTITFFAVGAGLAYLPSPDLLSKLLAFSSFVTGSVYLVDALAKVEEIGSLKGLADQLTDFSSRLYTTEAQELVLFKDNVKTVSFQASYRNLIKTDKSSTVPIIADVFTAEGSLNKMYTDIVAGYSKITSWFKKLAPTFPGYNNPIKTTPSTITYPMAGNKLVLKNVSDTAIKLTYTAIDTALKIKVVSSSITGDKKFSFDVSYTDPKLGVTITKKIDAVYKNKASGVTVAGGLGYGGAANQLASPTGFAMDAAGNFYISDLFNYRVQKWAPGATSGVTVAGGNGAGGDSNKLDYPHGIYMAGGVLYIADQTRQRIQRWVPGAAYGFTAVRGPEYDDYGSNANQLNSPTDVWVDANGNIYICDRENHRIQRWAPGATSGVTVAGGNGKGNAANQLSRPEGIYLDASGNLYIADTDNSRVQKWAPGAASGVTVAGGNGKGSAANQVSGPVDIVLDAAGNFYIADASGNRIMKWVPGAAAGTVIISSELGSGADQLWGPVEIELDNKGSIYILEKGNVRITKWAL
jgi:hypothetical protein